MKRSGEKPTAALQENNVPVHHNAKVYSYHCIVRCFHSQSCMECSEIVRSISF